MFANLHRPRCPIPAKHHEIQRLASRSVLRSVVRKVGMHVERLYQALCCRLGVERAIQLTYPLIAPHHCATPDTMEYHRGETVLRGVELLVETRFAKTFGDLQQPHLVRMFLNRAHDKAELVMRDTASPSSSRTLGHSDPISHVGTIHQV